MKTFLLTLALTVVFGAATPLIVVAAEPHPVVIHDFGQGGFDYGFGAWGGLGVQSKTDHGYRIDAPANGGAGFSLFQIADLSDCKTLVLKIKRGPSMTDSRVVINLISVDGAKNSWVVQADALSEKDFTEVKLDLAKPTDHSDKPLNLEEIKNVQVQGVFTPDKTVDVEFASITALP